ncbi:MAG: LysR family transcriptional regulator [Candidatus Lactobacillus pullistercoris]|uniref:LysR family transcriptional regulator n=1 Tax=Candidatus Lactobacillus pullistercoris TaxID=2838636 RepID=A0A9E2KQU1_9LACO|nr:LysR family transcriptional regulator [Candidatus Lactobacillus pullistercoris]
MPKTDTILSAKSLRYFLQLIDTMNYTQAAQILGITQPALTQQIKKLEHAIGAPLFGQMGKKLYLTEAGKEMQTAAVELLDTINSVVDNIQEFTQADKGNIAIGVLGSLDTDLFRQFLIAFNQKYPKINIQIAAYNREDLWRNLDNNSIDLAIMNLPDNTKRDEINLQHQYNHEAIFKDRLLILTHKDSVEAGKEYPISRFLRRKWVSYPENYYLTQLMTEYFGNKNKLNVPLTFSKTQSLIKTAQETEYDTYIRKSYYVAHKKEIKLTPVYLKKDKKFEISLVYRKGKLEIPRIKNLLKEWNIFLDKKDYSSRLEEND